jgi:hypothetical protein
MLEIQGIPEADGVKVAALLRRCLGWTVTGRRAIEAIAAVPIAAALAVPIWHKLPPGFPIYNGDTNSPHGAEHAIRDCSDCSRIGVLFLTDMQGLRTEASREVHSRNEHPSTRNKNG